MPRKQHRLEPVFGMAGGGFSTEQRAAGGFGRRDLAAAAIALAAAIVITVNALLLQTGSHPSPFFAAKRAVAIEKAPVDSVSTVSVLPRPRPAEAETSRIATPPEKEMKPNAMPRVRVESRPAARPDPIADLIAPSARIVAVQKALSQFGYGQIAPNGVMGQDTKAAIERFERENGLPVTGETGERTIRKLSAVTGERID